MQVFASGYNIQENEFVSICVPKIHSINIDEMCVFGKPYTYGKFLYLYMAI